MAVVLRIARDAYRVNDVCSTTLFSTSMMAVDRSLYEDVTLDQLETQLLSPSAQRPKMKELQFVRRGEENFPGEIVLQWSDAGQRSWRAFAMTVNDYERIRTEVKDLKIGRVERLNQDSAAESNKSSSFGSIALVVLMVVAGLGVPAFGLWLMSRMGCCRGRRRERDRQEIRRSMDRTRSAQRDL